MENEVDAAGCKVTHDITLPEMVVVVDEVGGNTNQKGDGHIGGELMMCEPGKTAQRKINTKDKHYTILTPTALNGEPVMCCIIFTGKKSTTLIETGLDLNAETIGNVSDDDFFVKNSGPGKRFSGGSTCTFRNKKVPCFCAWSPKGGITSDILTDIIRTFDTFELSPRINNIKPVIPLDGHGCRFELPFLSYIHDPSHEWVVVIGVPYGTALWQVGDSPEQNGSFNMVSVRKKREIVNEKETMMVLPSVEPYEIVNIVNAA